MRKIDRLSGMDYGENSQETIVAAALLSYIRDLPEDEAVKILKDMMPGVSQERVTVIMGNGPVIMVNKVDPRLFAEAVDNAAKYTREVLYKDAGDFEKNILEKGLPYVHGEKYLKFVPDELTILVNDMYFSLLFGD